MTLDYLTITSNSRSHWKAVEVIMYAGLELQRLFSNKRTTTDFNQRPEVIKRVCHCALNHM